MTNPPTEHVDGMTPEDEDSRAADWHLAEAIEEVKHAAAAQAAAHRHDDDPGDDAA